MRAAYIDRVAAVIAGVGLIKLLVERFTRGRP